MKNISLFLGLSVLFGSFAIPGYSQIQIGGLLRDEFALGLTPPIKSAGMGGAYVAVDRTQSYNPAALSVVEQLEAGLTYGIYDLDEGPTTHRGRLDAIAPVPYLGGGARIMLDGFASDGEGETLLPGDLPVEFDSTTLGLQYGRNITDWLAVGFGGYPYETAHIDLITPGGTIEGQAISQVGSIQLGTILRPHEKINVGGQFIYIRDDLEVDFPAGGGESGDYFNIHYFALGVAVMPFEGTLVAVDYWNGEIEGHVDTSTNFDQDIDRWNFGIEQRVHEKVYLRAGSDNGGLTAGFTVRFNDSIDLDYAFINEELGDKADVFGETQFHGVALIYRF